MQKIKFSGLTLATYQYCDALFIADLEESMVYGGNYFRKKGKIILCVADFMYETDGKIWVDLFSAVMPCDEQVT